MRLMICRRIVMRHVSDSSCLSRLGAADDARAEDGALRFGNALTSAPTPCIYGPLYPFHWSEDDDDVVEPPGDWAQWQADQVERGIAMHAPRSIMA